MNDQSNTGYNIETVQFYDNKNTIVFETKYYILIKYIIKIIKMN